MTAYLYRLGAPMSTYTISNVALVMESGEEINNFQNLSKKMITGIMFPYDSLAYFGFRNQIQSL